MGSGLKTKEIHGEHGDDETHRAEDADGREVLDGVHAILIQRTESHRVAEGNRGHVEGDAQGVGDENLRHADRLAGTEGGISRVQHESTCDEVAKSEKTVTGNPAVCHHADQTGHEKRNETLNGIEPTNLGRQTVRGEETAHGGEIGTPNGKLKKIHCHQAALEK